MSDNTTKSQKVKLSKILSESGAGFVLSAYENGRKLPNLRTLALIAASLDMTMAELLQNNTAGRG